MLRVKIELVPFGQEEGTRTLHTAYIGNVGGDSEIGVYDAWLDVDPRGFLPRPSPHAHIPRYKRARGAAVLTQKVLALLTRKK